MPSDWAFFVDVNKMFNTSFFPVYMVRSLLESFPCLYGLGEGVCSYDPSSAQTYFTLGDAVAGLGLVAAVVQLSNVEWRMVRKIRGKFLSNLWVLLGVLALVFVFMASFVTQISGMIPPFSYPIFWEHLGLVFFVLSPLSYWFVANSRRWLFDRRTAINFYHVMMVTAVDGRTERLESAINIMRDNLDDLVRSVGLIDSYFPKDKIPDELEYAIYAEELLNTMLSDKVVVSYISCNRMDFLVSLFQLLKKYRVSRSALSMGLNRIVGELLNNRESYLYRQLDYQGTTLYAPLYKLIFGDPFFVGEYAALRQWDYGASDGSNYDQLKVNVFMKALNSALDLDVFEDASLSREVSFVLFQLSDFATSAIWLSGKSSLVWGKSVSAIERFLGHDFIDAYNKALVKKKVSQEEASATLQGKYRSCLTASYAMVLVEYLGALSSGNDRNSERSRALDVTHGLVDMFQANPSLSQLRESFFEYMWEKVKENVERGFFPPVFRVFLEVMYWKSGGLPKWYLDERKKLISYMRTELKPRIKSKDKKDQLMANYKDSKESVLLPDSIVFDKRKDNFYIVWDDGSKKVLR